MAIVLLLVVGLAWWLHRRGELLPNLQRLAVAGGLLFAVVRLVQTGKPLLALATAAGSALWWLYEMRRRPPPAATELAAARALLGVGEAADAAAIRAAYRQLMLSAHPDAGGSADFATRVSAARDLLLGQLADD
ncbi:MAG: molecular chaperone DnaJ [Polymorphobacter sp.]